jgi:nucleotide-binding universal stress UspA family protein
VQACAIAAGIGATPLVLHVVHDPGDMPGYYSSALRKKKILGRIEDGAADMLDDFLAGAAKRHKEIAVCPDMETVLVRGLPSTRIMEVAQQREVKMIVMGSQGHTGFKRLMMGSVAEKVVRLSPLPVTVVKS